MLIQKLAPDELTEPKTEKKLINGIPYRPIDLTKTDRRQISKTMTPTIRISKNRKKTNFQLVVPRVTTAPGEQAPIRQPLISRYASKSLKPILDFCEKMIYIDIISTFVGIAVFLISLLMVKTTLTIGVEPQKFKNDFLKEFGRIFENIRHSHFIAGNTLTFCVLAPFLPAYVWLYCRNFPKFFSFWRIRKLLILRSFLYAFIAGLNTFCFFYSFKEFQHPYYTQQIKKQFLRFVQVVAFFITFYAIWQAFETTRICLVVMKEYRIYRKLKRSERRLRAVSQMLNTEKENFGVSGQ